MALRNAHYFKEGDRAKINRGLISDSRRMTPVGMHLGSVVPVTAAAPPHYVMGNGKTLDPFLPPERGELPGWLLKDEATEHLLL